MIPREILKEVRRIRIRTSRVVADVLAGGYMSVFRGRGMEFEEVRPYQVGDEVRSIDWNVTARTGEPFVKRFVEERQLTVLMMVDVSSSLSFGTAQRTKSRLAAEVGGVLAGTAANSNDKTGLVLFSDTIEKYVPPMRGTKHVLRVIRELLYHRPQSRGTNISAALEFLGRLRVRSAVVFLVSDFRSGDFEKALRVANKRHDVIAVEVCDPREEALVNAGEAWLQDAETGRVVSVATGHASVRHHFSRLAEKRRRALTDLFHAVGVDHIPLRTDRPYAEPLLKFFRMRERRFG